MATLSKLKVTKPPQFSLTDEEYRQKVQEVVSIDGVSLVKQLVLETVSTEGLAKTPSILHVRFNNLVKFMEEESVLVSEFEKRKELSIVENMLEILSANQNLCMAYSANDLSRHTAVKLLLKHLYIKEVCKLVTEKEVMAYMSSQNSSNAVRLMSKRFREPTKEILKYLSPKATERFRSHLRLERQTAIVIGLKKLGMNFIEIAKELELNPRLVGRLIDNHKRGKTNYPPTMELFNRVSKLKGEKLSNEEIANKLGLKLETLSMVLEKKKV